MNLWWNTGYLIRVYDGYALISEMSIRLDLYSKDRLITDIFRSDSDIFR